ncbi:MAG: protoglobin domain-containing protein [Anaerolineae bacterium]|jgi:hypothetical protein
MAWADKVRLCIDWQERDKEGLAKLRTWLDSESKEMIEDLAKCLIRYNGVQPLMRNARFVRRLHDVLHEWLTGLFDEAFDRERAETRRALAEKLVDMDLTFEDVILLEGMARQQLCELAVRHLDGQPQELSSTMQALNKVMTYDRALIYGGCLDLHDKRLEQTLLDRFLTVTGFSPTLYESLVEARGWNRNGSSRSGP